MKTNRIPLVVGVTGHRDLREEDRPALAAKVREILLDLKTRYPATPLVLLSSLAEGADRLVAQVALDAGIELFSPLPLPIEIYQADFATEVSHQEFTQLLGRASLSFVLPFATGVTAHNIESDSNREQQYARSGQYILRHCHILLALWDGDKSEKMGGTSQVVRQKLTGYPVVDRPDWTVLTPPDSGTVFHLVTPRRSNPSLSQPFQLREYHIDSSFAASREEGPQAEAKAARIFASLLQRTDSFNGDVSRFELPLSASFAHSRAALGPEDVPLDPGLQALRERFAASDALASHFQRKRCNSLFQLCFLALQSPVCLAAYHTARPEHPGEGLLYLVAFFLVGGWAFLVYGIAQKRGYETKHLDYRALAESFKVMFFWRLAGIRDDIGAQYLRKQRSEVDWIRLALRAADVMTVNLCSIESLPWIQTHWIEHQLHYFDRSARRNNQLKDTCDLAACLLVGIGVVTAGIMLAFHAYFYFSGVSMADDVFEAFHYLSVAIVGALAMGASITAFSEKLAFAQQAKQYDQMRSLFSVAVDECGACLKAGEQEHARTIMRRLGHEALRENGDWVLLHRERPMEIRL